MEQIQAVLTALWKEILNRDVINIDDNFFEVGGTSMKVITLFDRIYEVYPDRLKISDLFSYPTISTLSVIIKERTDQLERGEDLQVTF